MANGPLIFHEEDCPLCPIIWHHTVSFWLQIIIGNLLKFTYMIFHWLHSPIWFELLWSEFGRRVNRHPPSRILFGRFLEPGEGWTWHWLLCRFFGGLRMKLLYRLLFVILKTLPIFTTYTPRKSNMLRHFFSHKTKEMSDFKTARLPSWLSTISRVFPALVPSRSHTEMEGYHLKLL